MIWLTRRLALRAHLASMLATLVCAHAIGLIRVARCLPQANMALVGSAGQALGVALCGMTFILVLTLHRRRHLVTGPLYRCGESRPVVDYTMRFEPGAQRLLQSWQYR